MRNQSVVGVVPGFGSGRRSYQPLVEQLEENGCDVIFFPSVRGRGVPYGPEEYPQALARQAQIIVRLMKECGVKNVTLIGHSLGGAVATIAAALDPDVIRRIILVCSACVHPDSPLAVAKRFLGKAQGDVRDARSSGFDAKAMQRIIRKEALRYAFSNPWRTLAEAWALASFSALEVIAEHHIDARFVYGERDTMFACSPVEQSLRSGGHNSAHCLKLNISHDPQNKPDEAKLLVKALVHHQFLPTP